MIERRVAKRYVQGLLQAAKEKNCVGEVEQVLEKFARVIKENRDVPRILYHPTISRERKKKLLHGLLGRQVPDILERFMDYIIDKKRERILVLLYAEYRDAADKLRGIIRAKVRSAVQLTRGQVERLKNELEKNLGKKVEFEFELDKTILGGIQVFIGTYIIDGSLSGQLTRLHKHLLKNIVQLKTVS